ncbi:hypothetical protein D9758_014938 [Tetrapyrgos nigripes]|uniref:Beta-xylanase n=1 Tax=Tetrapyrgos nigripes TaxID=182062 RepID=A0A8H5FIF9_9AGAR|nr:hypothetical protein D9758_014938 [Tetrapyrgos nigripes]
MKISQRLSFALLLPSGFFLTVTARPQPETVVSSAPPASTASTTPNTAAKAAGKLYFGSATDNPEFTDAPYLAILSNQATFGQITAANSMKWDATEPAQGTFTLDAADTIANFAMGNGQLLRGHNIVWHNQLPSWVSEGNFDNATLTSILQNRASTLIGHFKGDIWDVVNEPFNEDGTMIDFVFTETIGPSYIDIALKAARAADPSTKLYINEFNIEFPGPKSTAMQNLVKDLKSQGTPIDGIGLQSHFIVGQVPSLSDLQANMEAFTALGVEVAITELDIRMLNVSIPEMEFEEMLAQQKVDYQNVITACNNVEKCIGVTVWDFTDKYSWIPGAFPGQGAACPWDDNLVKKPAFDGIIAGFQ